tara:strand:+ start:877 stop:1695 length:819 start_codon:yes stop_codon:yes gene_type:complete
MRNNLVNKTKWYLKNIFLFLYNPLLTIKNNFDFDFLNALQANKKFINENKIKYEPLNVDLLKKYSFDNENIESYSASEHLNKVINAEYFNDLHNYGYGEKIIKATSFAELNYIKTFHLYPANVFALNEVLDLVERESLKGGMIIDYPSGIGNIFLYLSKFFENDLFYGVDNFVQISQEDVSLYQKFIGNVSEINTIDYFYKHKNDKKIDVLISIELNLNLIIDNILELNPNYIIFETFYVSRFSHIKDKLSSKYDIYKINESIVIYKKSNLL